MSQMGEGEVPRERGGGIRPLKDVKGHIQIRRQKISSRVSGFYSNKTNSWIETCG